MSDTGPDIHSILNDDFFSDFNDVDFKSDKNDNGDKNNKGDHANFLANLSSSEFDNFPKLSGKIHLYPKDFLSLTNKVLDQYKKLSYIDYDHAYEEIDELNIKSTPTPTFQSLNDELTRIQAVKDRLVEIYAKIIKVYNTKKRCTEILQEAWGKFSDEKNAEKRKGDSIMVVHEFLIDLTKIDSLMRTCALVLKNLDSIQDTTSRRVTILQSILKIDSFSRSGLPDQTFTMGYKKFNENGDYYDNNDNDNGNGDNDDDDD